MSYMCIYIHINKYLSVRNRAADPKYSASKIDLGTTRWSDLGEVKYTSWMYWIYKIFSGLQLKRGLFSYFLYIVYKVIQFSFDF